MTNKEKQLLLTAIGGYLPYGIKAKVLGWNEEKGEVEVALRVDSIDTDGYVYFESNDYDVNYLSVEDCSLFLRPMSSMTEEEEKDFDKITNGDKGFYEDENGWIRCDNIHTKYGVWLKGCAELLDWLNKKMFDYRGLIPIGLAIEAKEGMY